MISQILLKTQLPFALSNLRFDSVKGVSFLANNSSRRHNEVWRRDELLFLGNQLITL
ncbi:MULTISPECIES: hypothetical protein [unclassified Tolypothrix]|uniref:hypothetical protein n=1 Tax=unclassified Tolypothrix TaxID=2649714 RepID=UPI0012D75171|nr:MULTISPECIES: hypothetical protein [unclassified Tolypothrix]MBE9087205.1 hypothetical protein [Tolypothrix sp. LEGE 11397]UYD24199.1 hypothetical protein HGR01_22235 [Tolypothrix sp. PCC 7712]UYD33572.1 hypothetical protein HG267_32475 [Tolypothrix sp. PCC 7601]